MIRSCRLAIVALLIVAALAAAAPTGSALYVSGCVGKDENTDQGFGCTPDGGTTENCELNDVQPHGYGIVVDLLCLEVHT